MLIAIEGGDGAGKALQSRMLAERLKQDGIDVELYSYPKYAAEHGKKIGLHLRGIEVMDVSDVCDEYIKDQQEDMAPIANRVKAGGVVVLDRFKFSTMAYQSSTGLTYEEVKRREIAAGLADPDIVFYVYVPPEVSMERKETQRKANNETQDRHEKDAGLQARVLDAYERMMREGWGAKRWIRIDGSGDAKSIHEEILEFVKAELDRNGEKAPTS